MAAPSKSETEMHQVTWIILNAVKHLQVGKIKLAQFLKGSKSKIVNPIAGEVIYGGLMWYDISTITGFIEQLENIGLIRRKAIQGYHFDYSILELTDAGKLVLEERKQIPLQVIRKIKPIAVGNSEKTTFQMIKNGKIVSEIAKERNLAESTIYSHIFRLIVNDCLSADSVISKEIYEKVMQAAKSISKAPSVKEVKELLPEISYEEIRCVLADYRKIKDNDLIEVDADKGIVKKLKTQFHNI